MKKIYILLFMTLCTLTMSAATGTYYKVKGALYGGMNENNSVSYFSVIAPDHSPITFTTFDGAKADWYQNNKLKSEQSSSFELNSGIGNSYPVVLKNYTGATQDYQYAVGKTTSYVRIAPDMMMLTMCNMAAMKEDGTYTADYLFTGACASTTTTYGPYKYGTGITYSTPVNAIETVVDNPGLMYLDYAVLGVYHQTVTDGEGSSMFPDGKKVRLELYPATITLGNDGKYSYSKISEEPVVSATATSTNYVENSKTSKNGALKFNFDKAYTLNGGFIARITWDEGCDFGILYDSYNLQKYTTFYCREGKTPTNLWSSGGNTINLSFHAMFPALYKDDASVEEIQIVKAGGDAKVTIHSNVDPKNITITSSADWITYDEESFTYEDTEKGFQSSKKSYITFAVAANEGAPRKGTITLNNRGKEITYTINQSGSANLQISSVGWGTYCLAATISAESIAKLGNLEIFKVKVEDGRIVKNKIENIPANTPVLVHSLTGARNISVSAPCGVGSPIDGNMVGVFVDGYVPYEPEGDYEYYVLQNLDSGLGFYRVNSSNFAIKANRAYLKIPKASAAKDFLSFEETPTGINEINSVAPVFDNKVYNIQGVSVGKNYKGIVISNGKKYIIK